MIWGSHPRVYIKTVGNKFHKPGNYRLHHDHLSLFGLAFVQHSYYFIPCRYVGCEGKVLLIKLSNPTLLKPITVIFLITKSSDTNYKYTERLVS